MTSLHFCGISFYDGAVSIPAGSVHVFLLLDHKFLESRGGISYELVKTFE